MRQVLQDLRSGATEVAEVPCPRPGRGEVLVRTTRSLVSAGTERMLVAFGKAGLIGKARQQPEKVRQALDKVRTDGLLPTLEAVRDKLDQPLPLGYCNVGRVIEIGAGVEGFRVGDRVASNGRHAEAVAVPALLCAKVPEAVTDEAASFTVLGAVALQGIRLAQPTLGEAVAVTGLGLVGLLTVQLLRSHGCRVLGIDFDPERLALARSFGADVVDLSAGEDALARAAAFSRGRGMDAVIVTAATTSSEPIRQAAQMSRKRGRVVLVGVAGLELSRADFYEKELTFQVSCSYGPGRYDPDYEEKGRDYPVGFVRWTQGRNFEAVLDMMAEGRLDVSQLVSHRFAIEKAAAAYKLLASEEPSLGILIEYPDETGTAVAALRSASIRLAGAAPRAAGKQPRVAVIGAGGHATRSLIPALRAAGAQLKIVASSGGVSALHAARRHGFEQAVTDADAIFADAAVDAVVIATRHDCHARLVLEALEAGKHVFVEKPLCLTLDELEAIEARHRSLTEAGRAPVLMVGFNRRFAPHVVKMKALLDGVADPKAFVATVNAGAVPAGHWTQDPETGGGRILGEACHFVDLLRHLAGSPIVGCSKIATPAATGDTASLSLAFQDGSIGTIHYLANGHRSFPKERIEVFGGGRVLQLDNFRRLTGYGWPGFRAMRLWRQDKGHRACMAAFMEAVRRGRPAPIPFAELAEIARATLRLASPGREP
jgi:predicted dehydrogenase/threonine dehydrogenase-like Zn-dependent dehydrogenase